MKNRKKDEKIENAEALNADIVISGLIFGEDGKSHEGAVAIKDGCYMAIGSCDEIADYIGIDTIMCGYRHKSLLAGLYMDATGDFVGETGTSFRSEGHYEVRSDVPGIMRVGETAELAVYDKSMESFDSKEIMNTAILLKIADGEIVYRRRERVRKAYLTI